MNNIQKVITVCAASLAISGFSYGGTAMVSAGKGVGKGAAAKTEAAAENPLAKIWGLTQLYKSDSGFLNELAITGRYHGQYWSADGDEKSDDDYDNRRFRLGLKAILLDKAVELKGEIFSDLNSGGEFYKGFTELNLGFKASDSLTITVGKQKPKFGQEWTLSSRLIPTFERSLLTNAYKPDYTAGISAAGKSGALDYYLGAFANDATEEMADFGGGVSFTGTVSTDAKAIFGTEKATVGLGYLHNEREEGDTIFSTVDDAISIHANLKQGAVGLSAEALYLMGDSNNVGLSITPTYDLCENLQFVARYQVASSDGSLSAAKRYESNAGVGSGDLYNAFYAGFNYFIYDQKLKLMGGVEYADMDGGGDALTFLAGVRAYW